MSVVFLLWSVALSLAARPLPRADEMYDNGADYGKVGVRGRGRERARTPAAC